MVDTPAFQRILVCLDLEAGSAALARYSANLVRQSGGAVHLLHVLTHGATDQPEQRAHRRLSAIIQAQLSAVAIAHIEVRAGIPEDVILQHAQDYNIDLILLGHRRESVERIHVGSTTRAVISLTPLPVLVVPLNDLSSS